MTSPVEMTLQPPDNEWVAQVSLLRPGCAGPLNTPSSLLIPYLSLTPPLVAFRSTRDMQDLLMILYTTAFFVVALLYVRACEKLR
jgi:hypothetical protein